MARQFNDPVKSDEPYPEWFIQLLTGGSLLGWFSQPASSKPTIGSSTLTNSGGPVPTGLVTDSSPQPTPRQRGTKRDVDAVLDMELSHALEKRQTLTPDQRKVFQLAVFKLYIDTLVLEGNNITNLCLNINVTALANDGIDGDAASSYVCAKATAPATSTTGSITVASSELATLPLNTSPVTSVPTLTANSSSTAVSNTDTSVTSRTTPVSTTSCTKSLASPLTSARDYAYGYGYQKRSEPSMDHIAAYICNEVPYDVFVDAGFEDRYQELCLARSL